MQWNLNIVTVTDLELNRESKSDTVLHFTSKWYWKATSNIGYIYLHAILHYNSKTYENTCIKSRQIKYTLPFMILSLGARLEKCYELSYNINNKEFALCGKHDRLLARCVNMLAVSLRMRAGSWEILVFILPKLQPNLSPTCETLLNAVGRLDQEDSFQ